jgi:hypothetical protein
MAVEASLDSLRELIGARNTNDDDLLSWALEAATDVIRPQVYEHAWGRSAVQYAVLLQANRYYKRRTSATGVEGFGAEGFAVRVSTIDPDVEAQIAPYRDMSRAGVA